MKVRYLAQLTAVIWFLCAVGTSDVGAKITGVGLGVAFLLLSNRD